MQNKQRYLHVTVLFFLLLIITVKTMIAGEGDYLAISVHHAAYLRSGIALLCWLLLFLVSYYGLSSFQNAPWAKYLMLGWFLLAAITFCIRAFLQSGAPQLLHANLWNFLISIYNAERILLIYVVLWSIDRVIGKAKLKLEQDNKNYIPNSPTV